MPQPNVANGDLMELILWLAAFAGLIALLAVFVFLMKRWYVRTRSADFKDEMMTDLRSLVDAGEISMEEYQKIREKMRGKGRSGTTPKSAPKPQSPSFPTNPEESE